MANIYEQKNQDLHKLLDDAKCGDGATVLIPDLQRPYVWTPNQVVLLVDSLIRGWPFGTLLMWKAGPGELERIPHRQFWQVVDRTDEDTGTVVARKNPPASFHMVLDGQQRVQSLLLALGGDGWGFKLEDRAWKQELLDIKPRGRAPKYSHWSKASLCFDVDAFLNAYSAAENVQAIDYRAVLKWVVTDPADGKSKWKKQTNYVEPLLLASDSRYHGRLVRLSRLWAAVTPNPVLKEKQFREAAAELFSENAISADKVAQLLTPIGELMSTIRDVKLSKITFLELQEFNEAVWAEDAYNDAIVNIFTRLNTAGRALTRQEITLAWLKVGWESSLTGDLTAGQCFSNLEEELLDRGVKVDIDELVMAVSFIWSVVCNEGKLLANKDLLKGSAIQPMAHELSKRWTLICESILQGLDRLKQHGLRYGAGGQFDSLYAVAVLWSWLYMAKQWTSDHPESVLARDSFEKSVWKAFDGVADRWLFGSSWAYLWSSSPAESAQRVAKQLAATSKEIIVAATGTTVLELLAHQSDALIKDIEAAATMSINALSVYHRSAVSAYRDYLWIWHRIDKERWAKSSIPLRTTGHATTDIEVDHLVPIGLFNEFAKTAAAGDEQKFHELQRPINLIGNCSLLEKSFNISKCDRELAQFLAGVHEFKEGLMSVEDWASAMSVSAALLNPKSENIESIVNAIKTREKLIKQELVEFIQGKRVRVDND